MKEFGSKWKWITVTLFILTVLFAVSWEFAFSKAIGAFLSHSISNSGRNLKINNIYREKEHWVIDRPCLCNGDDEDNAVFKASRAILNYTVDLWNGKIDLYVTLDQPEFRVPKNDPHFALDVNHLEASDSFFQWNRFVAIRNGSLYTGRTPSMISREICSSAPLARAICMSISGKVKIITSL